MSDEEADIAACICRHSAGVVGGIAPGPQPGQVLVTVQNDGVLCYDTATKVSWRRVSGACATACHRNSTSAVTKCRCSSLRSGPCRVTYLDRRHSAIRA